MSLGIPAITIDGGGRGTDAHALVESFDTTDSWKGTQRALLLAIALGAAVGLRRLEALGSRLEVPGSASSVLGAPSRSSRKRASSRARWARIAAIGSDQPSQEREVRQAQQSQLYRYRFRDDHREQVDQGGDGKTAQTAGGLLRRERRLRTPWPSAPRPVGSAACQARRSPLRRTPGGSGRCARLQSGAAGWPRTWPGARSAERWPRPGRAGQ